MDERNENLLEVAGLKKYFPVRAGLFKRTVAWVKAVDDISFNVRRGATLGLVGESGCGKTTAGRTLIGLYPPTEGELFFDVPRDRIDEIQFLRRRLAELQSAGTKREAEKKDGSEGAGKNTAERVDAGKGTAVSHRELAEVKARLEVLRKHHDVYSLPKRELASKRREFQMMFQDPYGSLNPRIPIGDIIAEGLDIHQVYANKAERKEQVRALMEATGLDPAYINRYPHEFSGGQRQRIGIARALALKPKLLVLDEPVSALDVSIRVQILELLNQLKADFGLTYIFIAHDLSVVEYFSDRVAVMYLGKIVEVADRRSLYEDKLHPYTQALISAVPVPDPNRERQRIILSGDVPSPINPPSGCTFHPRCRFCMDICKIREPVSVEAKPGHSVSCHLYSRD